MNRRIAQVKNREKIPDGIGVPPVFGQPVRATKDRFPSLIGGHALMLPPRGPTHKRRGANLPHWTADNATYFVTFRLADSLPQSVLSAYRRERDALLNCLRNGPRGMGVPPVLEQPVRPITAESHPASSSEGHGYDTAQAKLQQLWSAKIEAALDSGAGNCWMRNPAIAVIVQNALLFFHTDRYILHAWAVMPNHVHAVLRPKPPHELPDILHSWKSFTAKAANKKLARNGEFWQSEPYDHMVRDQADLEHCIEYTLSNPAKAGLRNWLWFGTSEAT